jgi:hypothetical protein
MLMYVPKYPRKTYDSFHCTSTAPPEAILENDSSISDEEHYKDEYLQITRFDDDYTIDRKLAKKAKIERYRLYKANLEKINRSYRNGFYNGDEDDDDEEEDDGYDDYIAYMENNTQSFMNDMKEAEENETKNLAICEKEKLLHSSKVVTTTTTTTTTTTKDVTMKQQNNSTVKNVTVMSPPEGEGSISVIGGGTTTITRYNSLTINKNTPQCIIDAKNLIKQNKETPSQSIFEMSSDELANYLRGIILHQGHAMDDIAELVTTIIQNSSFLDMSNHEDNKPLVILLTGETGTGKTQCVKEFMILLEMDEGQIHHDAYIEYRLGDVSGKDQINIIKGASPGFVGFEKSECLYDKLVNASKHYAKLKQYKGSDGQLKPHIILLFFDELDKAPVKLMNILNSLLRHGCIFGPKGEKYTIPSTTRLLVFFTANFGADQMIVKNATMLNHYHLAPEWVRLELGSKGYKGYDISRLGNIIPFFPPTKDQLMVILTKRFYDNLAKKDAFSRKYGPADITDETLYKFINAMLESHANCRGISDICETLDKSMNSFSLKSLRHFDEQLKKKNFNTFGGGGGGGGNNGSNGNNTSNMPSLHKVSYPLDPPPNFLYEKIPYRNDLSQEELWKDPLLSIALNDRINQRNIETCLQQNSPIELFGLTHSAIESPCLNVIVPVINNNVNIFYFNDPSLIDRNAELIGKQREMNMLVSNIKTVIDCAPDIKQETKNLINNLITNPSSSTKLQLSIHNANDEVEEGVVNNNTISSGGKKKNTKSTTKSKKSKEDEQTRMMITNNTVKNKNSSSSVGHQQKQQVQPPLKKKRKREDTKKKYDSQGGGGGGVSDTITNDNSSSSSSSSSSSYSSNMDDENEEDSHEYEEEFEEDLKSLLQCTKCKNFKPKVELGTKRKYHLKKRLKTTRYYFSLNKGQICNSCRTRQYRKNFDTVLNKQM